MKEWKPPVVTAQGLGFRVYRVQGLGFRPTSTHLRASTCAAATAAAWSPRPGERVIDNKHSAEIEA